MIINAGLFNLIPTTYKKNLKNFKPLKKRNSYIKSLDVIGFLYTKKHLSSINIRERFNLPVSKRLNWSDLKVQEGQIVNTNDSIYSTKFSFRTKQILSPCKGEIMLDEFEEKGIIKILDSKTMIPVKSMMSGLITNITKQSVSIKTKAIRVPLFSKSLQSNYELTKISDDIIYRIILEEELNYLENLNDMPIILILKNQDNIRNIINKNILDKKIFAILISTISIEDWLYFKKNYPELNILIHNGFDNNTKKDDFYNLFYRNLSGKNLFITNINNTLHLNILSEPNSIYKDKFPLYIETTGNESVIIINENFVGEIGKIINKEEETKINEIEYLERQDLRSEFLYNNKNYIIKINKSYYNITNLELSYF